MGRDLLRVLLTPSASDPSGDGATLGAEPGSTAKPRRTRVLALIGAVVFVVDQVFKWAVVTRLKLGEDLWLLPGVLSLRHQRNRWAAYGTLSGLPEPVAKLLLYLLPVVLLAAALRALSHVDHRRDGGAVVLGMSLTLGGAASNLFDRLARGFVIDYLGFFTRRVGSPTYNLADAAIVLGLFLMVRYLRTS